MSIVVAQALIDSVPFFTIRDPLGGDAVFVELAPQEPKTFEVRFETDVSSGTYVRRPADGSTSSYRVLPWRSRMRVVSN